MKKFRLMLVAFMAMFSTVAFADMTNGTLKFVEIGDKEVQITGFATSVPAASRAELIIPNTITNIADDESPAYKVVQVAYQAFKDETAITTVTFAGSNLTTIGQEAFAGCTALKTVSFTAATKLANIYQDAFKGAIIEELDLSKTAVVTIYNLFGTAPKHDVVKYTDTSADDFNTALGTRLGFGKAAAGPIGTEQAKGWNATLTGALVVNEDASKNKFTAATAAAYNATLAGAVKAGVAITDEHKALYNTTLTGAFNYNDVQYVKEGKFTALGAAYYKVYVDATATTIAENSDFSATEKGKADTYNATKSGALTGTAFNAAQATAYNALLEGAKKADDPFNATQADPFNATLEGAVATDGTATFGETTVTVDAFNAKFGFVKSGDVQYPAEAAVTNSTLASVSLPATWTTFQNSYYDVTVAGAFENCTKLATISFGTPAKDVTTQALETRAFVNTALTALDFTGTKIAGTLPANLLIDGVNTKKNETLATITLNGKDGITNLNGNFAFCTKLTAIDLTNLTISANEFEGSGLTAVEIPATLAAIPASAFKDCASLATVTYGTPAEGEAIALAEIGTSAFAGTGLTSFTVPSAFPYTVATKVADNAFADCSKLTSFTYKPNITTGTVLKVVSDNAFLGCEDGITFYTVKEYAEAAAVAKKAPTHSTFSYDASPAGDPTEAKELTAKAFKQTSKAGMYFVKYNSKNGTKQNIKIAKTDAKVYAAYNDDTDGTIIMQAFKPKGGYYHIAAGDNVLILSNSEKIPYETTSVDGGSNPIAEDGSVLPANAGNGSSWLASAAAATPENMLKYVSDEAGVKRSTLEAQLTGPFAGYNIYAWANTTDFTGWKKITSGSTFPQNTLYIFAKPAAAAEGVRVIWLDENGNIEEETTAIQGIESVEEAGNGASYNLAGQKVNAAYKGVVIKDGKKYIMK